MAKEEVNITETMKKLRAITEWFESQEEVDVEKGIEKIKEGAELIKKSKARLRELENEFDDIKKNLASDD